MNEIKENCYVLSDDELIFKILFAGRKGKYQYFMVKKCDKNFNVLENSSTLIISHDSIKDWDADPINLKRRNLELWI